MMMLIRHDFQKAILFALMPILIRRLIGATPYNAQFRRCRRDCYRTIIAMPVSRYYTMPLMMTLSR